MYGSVLWSSERYDIILYCESHLVVRSRWSHGGRHKCRIPQLMSNFKTWNIVTDDNDERVNESKVELSASSFREVIILLDYLLKTRLT